MSFRSAGFQPATTSVRTRAQVLANSARPSSLLRIENPHSEKNGGTSSRRRYTAPVRGQTEFLELPGLRVTLDQVVHHREAQTPPDRPHCFAYHITIHNDSDVTVTI